VTNNCTEMVTFEVVDFSGPYHIILGWSCYVKSMAIPSYAYLKPKIPEAYHIILGWLCYVKFTAIPSSGPCTVSRTASSWPPPRSLQPN
jgi:hypothetical protein